MTPSEALASAVLRQAVQDLFLKSSSQAGRVSNDGNPSVDDKVASVRFLTDEAGAFAQSRAFWASWAGKDGDRLRATAVAFLEGGDDLLPHFAGGYSTPDRADILAHSIAESRRIYSERKRASDEARAAWLEANRLRKLNLERSRLVDACRREKAERRAAMRQWQAGRMSAIDGEVARLVDALQEGPLSISRICNRIELGYEAANLRLEEAARRGLVERVGKGVWQLAPSSVEAAPSSVLVASR